MCLVRERYSSAGFQVHSHGVGFKIMFAVLISCVFSSVSHPIVCSELDSEKQLKMKNGSRELTFQPTR